VFGERIGEGMVLSCISFPEYGFIVFENYG
jgi:hypothetical protein